MSLLQEYAQLEQQAKELQKKMALLQEKEEFKKEKEFLDKLRDLIEEFGKTPQDVINQLSPQRIHSTTTENRRKKRKLKVYRNPNTNEVVETRGGNHKTLRSWKEEYGAEVVESWLVEER